MSDVTTHLFPDASERKITVLRVQDCEPIVENNKRLQNEPQKSETFRHVASIPNVIIEQWLIRDGTAACRLGILGIRHAQDHDRSRLEMA